MNRQKLVHIQSHIANAERIPNEITCPRFTSVYK